MWVLFDVGASANPNKSLSLERADRWDMNETGLKLATTFTASELWNSALHSDIQYNGPCSYRIRIAMFYNIGPLPFIFFKLLPRLKQFLQPSPRSNEEKLWTRRRVGWECWGDAWLGCAPSRGRWSHSHVAMSQWATGLCGRGLWISLYMAVDSELLWPWTLN